MPVEYTNCRRDRYYLHEGVTKKGNPKYYFSRKTDGNLCQQIPDGYEVFEDPNGGVYLQKIQIPLVTASEIEIIRNSIPEDVRHKVVSKGKTITIYTAEYTNYQATMRFILANDHPRTFDAQRYCFRGSIDDWIHLSSSGNLAELARKCCVHLGRESFFDLPYMVDGF
ncbi:MAG: hypothetical protein M0Z41_06635 [Peptococcaceae bacterium]|jgi:hypothetical protein|nr:hypothetical protein [Peptococcaceae bacterium]